MRRPNRSVVGFCIVIVALSAVLPGISALDYAVFEPQWVLLPDDTPTAVCITAGPCNEQLLSLQSFLPSRAPPSVPNA
jgi:hypothetical protein